MSGILTKLAKAAKQPVKREANLEKFLKPSAEKGRLYHGTTSADELTDTADQPISQFTTSPTWLAKEPTTANRYAGNKGAVYPVFAQIRNPLKMQFDADDRADKALALAASIGADVDYIKGMSKPIFAWEVINHPHFIEKARAAGYDGFAVSESGQMTYGVFDPSKIKSATGNRGTFSTKTPELSKAAGGLMEHLDPGYEAESIRRFMDEERKKKVAQPSGGAAFGIYPSSGKGRKYGPVSRALDTGEAQVAAAKGLTMMPQNLAGMPVDLINLALAPLGLASEKPVMGSDWLKEQSRRAGLAFAEPQDPTLGGFFAAGDIASNLINPVAATRSVASGVSKAAGAVAPKAAEMAEGYLQASGLAPAVIKPKGGNWITGQVTGSIEAATTPLKRQELPDLFPELGEPPPNSPTNIALNQWIDQKLNKYIRNEMGTPEDPVRKLAEQGILHFEPEAMPRYMEDVWAMREKTGFPKMQGTSPLAQKWEAYADQMIRAKQLGEPIRSDATSGLTMKDLVASEPGGEWALKASDDQMIYELRRPGTSSAQIVLEELGLPHLIDELRNATRPDSDLPARLRWKPEDLQKVTMEQAVRRVHEINEYRAAKKAEANEVLARNPATAPYRDYDTIPGTDQPNNKGLSWKQIQAPKDIPLPNGYKVIPDPITNRKTGAVDNNSFRLVDPDGKIVSWGQSEKEAISAGIGKKYLEDALKYEGDVMGHCVGGYCDDVLSGRSQIFSLRDKKGEPHVTIEVRPSAQRDKYYTDWMRQQPEAIQDEVTAAAIEYNAANPKLGYGESLNKVLRDRIGEVPHEIIQIKGKGNLAPNAEYLPFVQDFVRSGNWSRVGDFNNTGLYRKSDFIDEFTPQQLDSIGKGEYLTMNEIKKLREGKNWKPIDTDPDLDIDPNLLRAKGGEVHAAGGGLMEHLDPGYEPEVIRRKGDTALDLPTTNLTPQERDLAPRRKPVPEAPLAQATALNAPSMRERHAEGAQKFLRTITPRAGSIAGAIFGGEKSPLPLGLGLADFPVLSPYLPEEAGFMIGQGAGTGSAAETAMGAGLGALSVLPFAKPAATAVKAAGKAVAPAVGQMAEGYLQSTGLAPSIVARPNQFGFFSAAEEAALTTPRKAGPGQGFLNDLRKAGVSKEELEPTGIADFLKSKPSVTREEVQQFVKQNKPDVQVKVLSDPTRHPNQDLLGEHGLKYDHILDQITPLDRPLGEYKSGQTQTFSRWYDNEIYEQSPEYKQWVDEMEELGQEIYRAMPKFDEPTLLLPGGSNYREVSLNLRGPEMHRVPSPHSLGGNDTDINRLAHVRMNDRVDADGKKVLFIEELQSDWGQEGKRRGFQTKEFKKAEKEFNEYSQQLADKYGLNPKQNLAMYATMKGISPEEVKAYEDLQQKYISSKGAISEAPFVTKTNDWVDLGLKHIMKMAADEGYSKVAFINGTQSADRYDLSKRVDQLLYKKNDDGTYKLSAQAGGRGNMIGERISEDKLADYVGKDIADKIVSDTGIRINLGGSSASQPEDMWGSLSGQGLKVGGEGMKDFYDKIVPGQINALLKKFGGGKLGDVNIKTDDGVLTQPGFEITPELRKKLREPMSYAEGGAVSMVDTIAQQLQSSGMDADKALMHALRMQAAKDAAPITVSPRPEIEGAEDFKQAVMQKFQAGGIARIASLAGKGGKKTTEKAGASILQTAPAKVSVEDLSATQRELQGLLKPQKDPVRGQTSRELLQAQRANLTNEQKELLDSLKRQYPNFAQSVKFMTPQEVTKIISNPEGVREVNRLLEILPQAKQIASVAKAGEAKRGWYRASTQALMDVFGDDAPRFATLLASLSPQTSVEMNLLNTLNVWKNWTAAGRPTDPMLIKQIMGRSVAGTKGEESVLEAWTNNAIRSLTTPDVSKVTLSGPKVDSFFRNLADDVYKVTNDAWMASGLGVNQSLFSGSPTALQIARGDPGLTPGYIATSARMREAGQQANILPSEAQETTWSVFMPLYEMQASTGLPAREILQRGLLTPRAIRGTPDFSTLLRDPTYGAILEQSGYGEKLSSLKPHKWSDPTMNLSLTEQRDLEQVAQRLEGLKVGRERESRAKVFGMPKEPPQAGFAFATPEYIPGRGIGHMEELVEAPIGSRKHFSSRAAGAFKDIQDRDVLQRALGLPVIETRSMTGAFRPSGEIPFASGRLGGETIPGRQPIETQPGFALGAEVPITGGLDVPARIKRKLTAAEALRGSMTAQHGSPWNLQIPTESGTGLFVPLEKKVDPEYMGYSASIMNPATEALADTGRGVSVLNWGDPISLEQAKEIAQRIGGKEAVPTKTVSDYVDYSQEWMQPPGSGAVTRKMLDYLEGLSARDVQALSEAAKQPAEELHNLYELTKRTKGYATREDLMNLLRVLRDKGIPGVITGLAAGEAFPAQEKKKTGGLSALQSK